MGIGMKKNKKCVRKGMKKTKLFMGIWMILRLTIGVA